MASGRPVIAYRGGGALETIEEGKSGIFFSEQTEESLLRALKDFKQEEFNSGTCRAQAEKFDIVVFREKILKRFKI